MSALREAMSELPDAVFVDLLERDDAYLLVIDLPGVTADTLELQTTAGRLTIEARRRKPHDPTYSYRTEQRSSFLDAELPLPPDADGAAASADLEQGVLEVQLPKRDGNAGTTIEIEG